MNSLISLRINNKPYSYLSALTIFQACLEKKIFIPRFCYHVALKIAGNCRMCLVEEKSSLKPVASCAVTIVAGMNIFTQTELVKKAREGVIEYLLVNHPLDCPICDQGGECDLQDQTMVFGSDRGRFYETKRSTSNKNLGFLVKTFLNRCIHCARCTRFLHDVAGVPSLNLLGRGYKTEISTYINNFLKGEITGNIIDLCPVGALTSKPYAFRARPWELVSVYLFDIIEPFGASIELNYRGLELLRVLPRVNYEINEEWISDKTRFYYDAFNLQRLTSSYLVRFGSYDPISWLGVFNYWKSVLFSVYRNESNLGQSQVAFLLRHGDYADFETIAAFGTFANEHGNFFLPKNNSDFVSSIYGSPTAHKMLFNSQYEEEIPDQVVLVGVSPRLESPILNIKLRRFATEHNIKIFTVGFYGVLNYEAVQLGSIQSPVITQKLASLVADRRSLVITSLVALSNIPAASNVYFVAESLGFLSQRELLGREHLGFLWGNFKFFLGQPEQKFFVKNGNEFVLAIVSHVEDSFWSMMGRWTGLKLPAKFYLEKVSSYCSESGYFFSTLINVFGAAIRGTKEEWAILYALSEVGGSFLNKNAVSSLSSRSLGRSKESIFLDCAFEVDNREIANSVLSGRITNYFTNTLLARISPILSLCARSYISNSDYTFETR